MPRRAAIAVFAVCACAVFALAVPAGAVTQTTLAPGITYQKQVRLTSHGPVVVNVITTPKPGGLYRIVPLLTHSGLLGRGPLTTAEKTLSASTTAAGVNGDFFTPATGIPSGILLRSGALDNPPLDDRSSIGIVSDGTLRVEHVSFFGYWQGSGLQWPLGLNRINPANGATLYTPAFGSATPAAVNDLELVLNGFPPAVPDVDLSAQVAEARIGGGTPIPANGAVLIAGGTQVQTLTAEAPVGQTLTVRLTLTPLWNDVNDALGGGPILVSSGLPVFNALEYFTALDLARRQPRSAVGQRADGSIVLVTVDGGRPGYSSGLTNFELAQTMVRLGAVTACGLGTDTAATMAFDGQLLNRPSGPNGEASVSDALVIAYDGVFAPPPSEPVLSPNGDGAAESEQLSYKVVRQSTVSAALVGPDGQMRLSDSGAKAPGVYSFTWNGRNADGAPEPEGLWHWTITATDDLGRSSSADRTFQLDNTLGFLSLKPSQLRLRTQGSKLTIQVRLARSARTTVSVYSAAGNLIRTVLNTSAPAGTLTASWDGRNRYRQLVRSGLYQVRVLASAAAGPVGLSRSFQVQRLSR
ncbi:MAG: phosphodiester glycosidase family protein [Gaiellaceae bacterium]